MNRYLPIMVLLAIAAGCAPSARNNLHPSVALPNDVNSSGEAAFSEFDEELSKKQVTVADPFEPTNRLMYGFNDALYFWVAKPVMQTYEGAIPKPIRIGIRNFFENLTTPARLVNCLLQGKGPAAGRELNRFAVNTTAGVLGFGDPARDRLHIEPANEDLGQTLAVHGFDDGFYIVWPIFGPSTLRDSVGMAGDQFLNPVRYVEPVEASVGISAVNVANDGSFHIGEYEAFKTAAVDPYVAMRGAYIQYRKNLIRDQNSPAEPNIAKP